MTGARRSSLVALASLFTFAVGCEDGIERPPRTDDDVASRGTAVESRGPACPSPVPSHARVSGAAPPAGWLMTPAPAPASESIQCANYSRHEWRVGTNGDRVTVEARAPHENDAIPFTIAAKVHEGTAGTRHVRQVPDGFLVGFDAGEYGGALYWFSPDGARRQKLAAGNVIAIIELRSGLVALTGLAHLGMSEGRALKITQAGDAWASAPWLDLAGAVEAVAVESPDSALVLTTSHLLRVTSCGDVRELASPNHDALYPGSMAVDSRGVIYVGMRHYASRFVPAGDGTYTEEWMTREGCSVMRRKKFECECVR